MNTINYLDNNLDTIVNNLIKLDYYIINESQIFIYKYYEIINIDIKNFNFNKISNTINKLCIDKKYIKLNNLPLNLKWLKCCEVNCNLTPNIIYLDCIMLNDIYNLPKYLKFLHFSISIIDIPNNIFINTKIIKKKILNLLITYCSWVYSSYYKSNYYSQNFYNYYILK